MQTSIFTSQYHMFVWVVLMSILCIQPNCVLHFPFCLLFSSFFMAQFPFQRTISTNWWTVGSRVRPNHSKPPFLCLDHPCLFFYPPSFLFYVLYGSQILISENPCELSVVDPVNQCFGKFRISVSLSSVLYALFY